MVGHLQVTTRFSRNILRFCIYLQFIVFILAPLFIAPDLPEQRGPAVALRLGGATRSLAREIPQEQLRDGAIADPGDGGGARQLSGLQLLLLVLSKSFAPLGDENESRATSDLMGFYRKNHENIDQTLSRFEVTRRRAAALGGFQMGPQGYAWMLLTALGCSPTEWNELLIHFQGPSSEDGAAAQRARGIHQAVRPHP